MGWPWPVPPGAGVGWARLEPRAGPGEAVAPGRAETSGAVTGRAPCAGAPVSTRPAGHDPSAGAAGTEHRCAAGGAGDQSSGLALPVTAALTPIPAAAARITAPAASFIPSAAGIAVTPSLRPGCRCCA